MATSFPNEEDLFDMLSLDTPLLTPPLATPASGNEKPPSERQVTTRIPVSGSAQNVYVTVPESSHLLRDEQKLPALMANDTLPITDPRPFYASPYEKLPKSLVYTDFRSAYFPDVKRPDYNTTLHTQWSNMFAHINELDPANALEVSARPIDIIRKIGEINNQTPSQFILFRKLASIQKEYLKLDLNFPPHAWPTQHINNRRDAFVLALYYDNDVTLTSDILSFTNNAQNTFTPDTRLNVCKILSKFTLQKIEHICSLQTSIQPKNNQTEQQDSASNDSRSNSPSDCETVIYKSNPSSPQLTDLSDSTLELIMDPSSATSTSTTVTTSVSTAPFSARKRPHTSPTRSLYQETYTSLIREPSRKNLTGTLDFSVTSSQDMSSRDGSLDVHYNRYDPDTQRFRPLHVNCATSDSKISTRKIVYRHSPIKWSKNSPSDRSRRRYSDKRFQPFVPSYPPFFQNRFQSLTYNQMTRNTFSLNEFTNFLNIPTVTGYWHFVDLRSKQGIAPVNFRTNYPQSFRDLYPNDPYRDQYLQRKYPCSYFDYRLTARHFFPTAHRFTMDYSRRFDSLYNDQRRFTFPWSECHQTFDVTFRLLNPSNKDLHCSDRKTLHARATQTLSNFIFIQEHFNLNTPHARFMYAHREQTCPYYPHFAYKLNPLLRLGTIRNFDPVKNYVVFQPLNNPQRPLFVPIEALLPQEAIIQQQFSQMQFSLGLKSILETMQSKFCTEREKHIYNLLQHTESFIEFDKLLRAFAILLAANEEIEKMYPSLMETSGPASKQPKSSLDK